MDFSARQKQILEFLINGAAWNIEELAKKLGVSRVTIYEDIKCLSTISLIRDRGEIQFRSIPKDALEGTVIQEKIGTNEFIKEKVAEYVVDNLIKPNSVIFLDCGTSTLKIAEQIIQKRKLGLTIATINPLIIHLFFKHPTSICNLIVAGGILKQNTASLYGDLTKTCIRKISYDQFVLGVDSIDLDGNIRIYEEIEVEQKKILIAEASQVIIAVDDSKIGKKQPFQVQELEKISNKTKIIIGASLPLKEDVKKFKEKYEPLTTILEIKK